MTQSPGFRPATTGSAARDPGAASGRSVRVAVDAPDEAWLGALGAVEPISRGRDGSVLVALTDGATPQDVLDAARRAGAVTHFSLERPTLTDLFRKAVA